VLQKTIQPDDANAIIASATGSGSAMADVGGFVARPADTNGLTTAQIHATLGLDYPTSPFPASIANGEPFSDIVYAADPAVSPPAVASSASLWIRDEVPDSIWSLPAAERADAIRDYWDGLSPDQRDRFEQAYPSLGYELPKALDPTNPFRGNGFSGVGRDFLPEASYGPSRVALSDGAELWRTLPDGRREFVGVFRRPAPGLPGTWVTSAAVRPGTTP